jgi:hypothetical protein
MVLAMPGWEEQRDRDGWPGLSLDRGQMNKMCDLSQQLTNKRGLVRPVWDSDQKRGKEQFADEMVYLRGERGEEGASDLAQ